MIQVPVYNQTGEKVGTEKLSKSIFGLEINSSLVHQAAVAQYANRRRLYANSKDRSEVRGGGRKPWRQKGTGRARHGSIRSPLWRGGGVTFGPRTERNFSKKINKKMKRKAMCMCLSDKVREKRLLILDRLFLNERKTKKLVEVLMCLPCKDKKTLIALSKSDQNILGASKNLNWIKTITINSLNILDLLSYEYMLITVDGVKKIQELYLKS